MKADNTSAHLSGVYMERFDTEYFPIAIDEHRTLLTECGFKVVELLWFSYMQAGFYCI